MQKLNLRPRCQVSADFNLSAMTDIVFILLVFFLVTSAMEATEGLSVDLPTSAHAQPLEPTVKVTLTAEGTYFVNEQAVPWERLESTLQPLLAPGTGVLIQADQHLALGPVVQVANMAAAQQAAVSLATLPE